MKDITFEERLEVERTIWSINVVIYLSDYDKDNQNDTLCLLKIFACDASKIVFYNAW
jgi:hypothetical protein